jgi:MFS family permease
MQTAHPRRWAALAVITLAQFMVIMDTSIIGVALPEIQADLGFSPGDLSWVFNAYVVAFGGLLLLAGRLSDLFGAKRLFVIGWAVLATGRWPPDSQRPRASRSPPARSRASAPRSSRRPL